MINYNENISLSRREGCSSPFEIEPITITPGYLNMKQNPLRSSNNHGVNRTSLEIHKKNRHSPVNSSFSSKFWQSQLQNSQEGKNKKPDEIFIRRIALFSRSYSRIFDGKSLFKVKFYNNKHYSFKQEENHALLQKVYKLKKENKLLRQSQNSFHE